MQRALCRRSHRQEHRGEERGAVLVEFALVIPVVAALLLGTISFGSAYSKQLSLAHAAREGARYASTIPAAQGFDSDTWAENISTFLKSRAGGYLDDGGSTVCVSLVSGSPAATYVGDRSTAWYSTNTGGAPCIGGETYTVTPNDNGLRVQVVVTRPHRLEAVIYSKAITLRSSVTMQSESAS